jgi:hypothetical protein
VDGCACAAVHLDIPGVEDPYVATEGNEEQSEGKQKRESEDPVRRASAAAAGIQLPEQRFKPAESL